MIILLLLYFVGYPLAKLYKKLFRSNEVEQLCVGSNSFKELCHKCGVITLAIILLILYAIFV